MDCVLKGKGKDPLIPFLQSSENLPKNLRHVPNDILTKGYSIIPALISEDECRLALDLLWDFVQDVSGNIVKKDDPKSWYPDGSLYPTDNPIGKLSKAQDPWPHTGYNSFPDMFQSLGAGYLLGPIRQLMAERLFEHLLGTKELHVSKEGFTFARPTQVSINNQIHCWNRSSQLTDVKVCGKTQEGSLGEHYDQSHDMNGLFTIQSSVAFIDQNEESGDGHFVCYPHSHSDVHNEVTKDIYRGKFSWVPLTSEEVDGLNEKGSKVEHIYAKDRKSVV